MQIKEFLISLKLCIKKNWYPIILVVFAYHIIMIVFYNSVYFSSVSGFIGILIGALITFQFSIFRDLRQAFEQNKMYVLNKIIPLTIECEIFLLSQKTACLNSEDLMHENMKEDYYGFENPTREDRIEQSLSGDKNLHSFVKEDFLLIVLDLKYFCELHFNDLVNNEINNIQEKVMKFIKDKVSYVEQDFYENIYTDVKEIHSFILKFKKTIKKITYYENIKN